MHLGLAILPHVTPQMRLLARRAIIVGRILNSSARQSCTASFGRRKVGRLCSSVAKGEISSSLPASPRLPSPPTLQSQPQSGSFTHPPLPPPTFQEAIARLQTYWASVGCALWLPHNSEVGAGTMNPATFLRVLGPEPWNVAYPEPSIRPDDSRYGDNPNRVQRHTQFQVILKPDPGNPQELYLGSLRALGIDTDAHDIRFVEDNWESPVLGAWGLGWEVWMDGMEVTQFTYFQQAGGRALEVPAVEITYGLERIVMALQGVDHFKDIVYAPGGMTYGEMFLQNEYEMSRYNLDEADVEGQRHRFALYEAEARKLLAERLPIPAYEHLLKLSHAFNVLDARGAVGVTERADCFATLRGLARQITVLWLTRREELGFPLLRMAPGTGVETSSSSTSTSSAGNNLPPPPSEPATFVLEIGSEELPPDDVDSAVQQLRDHFPQMLDDLRLGHGGVTVEGTPRRLAVIVHALSPRQSPSEITVRGPPVKVAYDAVSGAPTQALLGFCRKQGVTVEDCFVDEASSEYVVVNKRDAGKSVSEVLPQALSALISGISFRKSMRWQGEVTYSRPMRWLLALYGATPLSLTYGNILTASNTTRLLRRHCSEGQEPEGAPDNTVTVTSADDYLPTLQAAGIELSITQRRDVIWKGVQEAAASFMYKGDTGYVPDSCRGDLLHEVANLVESPTIVCGEFDPVFLSLPTDVLVTVMRKHQRYFPIMSKSSAHQLLPAFVTVANGPVDVPTVQAGNQAVLRARFEDARFFYEADTSRRLEEVRPKLAGTVFHKELGSLLDKNERVEALVPELATVAVGPEILSDSNFNGQSDIEIAIKAAHLCKADLATSVVTEMTELAGVMGRHYALKEGYPEGVATAIFESVLPRHAGDEVPSTLPGLLVSLADKLDSLVGLFAAGCEPTASADPYGVRRAAVGLLQCLLVDERLKGFDLERAIHAAADVQPASVQPVTGECKAAVAAFVIKRLEQMLTSDSVPIEAVRAAVTERGNFPVLAAATARDIGREMEGGEASALYRVMTAMARPVRLTRGKEIDPSWECHSAEEMECDEERTLLTAYSRVQQQMRPDMTVAEFLVATEALVDPLDAYFEKVFVMCEDEGRRRGRLALMRDVAALPRGVLDLSELPGF